MSKQSYRIMISGGGTGGHVFPAIAIADALRRRYPNCEILFIGANGRMEMERVPQAGYEIKGLPVSGLNRKKLLSNIKVLFRLFRSIKLAKRYVLDFKPDLAVGVGGYASLPALLTAQNLGIPTVLQEQNSYAGMANKRLAPHAAAICVAYREMERFFPSEKIYLTGNPIRPEIELNPLPCREEAARRLGFKELEKPIIISVGGSLGALTLNESLAIGLEDIAKAGVGLLWQTGKGFLKTAQTRLETLPEALRGNIVIVPFIDNMADAYAVSDLLISRAGASTVSEIQLLGLPSILVPSPNVAEDHQTRNAEALVSNNAAEMVTDAQARELLVVRALELVKEKSELAMLGENVRKMALPHSADKIVDIISRLLSHGEN